MNMMVFCDIDGVLADCTHRLHYLKEKNYGRFYDDGEVIKDRLIYAGYGLIELFRKAGAEIHFVSSRNERCRNSTMRWLSEKDLIGSGIIAMRNENDFRPSPIVKVELIREIYNELAKKGMEYSPAKSIPSTYFIDDDPENVRVICETYPSIMGITFGTERMKK